VALPTAFEDASFDDPLADRARAVLATFAYSEREWEQTVRDDSDVKTTLSRISPTDAARLIRRGYVLAMSHTHVLLGYLLLPLPTSERFSDYVRRRVSPR
jgi:hypothetical protein